MNEFRSALQALMDVLTKDRDLSAQRGYVWHIDHACNQCTTDSVKGPSIPEGWRCAYHVAKALLARPEPSSPVHHVHIPPDNFYLTRSAELADTPTPKAQEGRWTLIGPDGSWWDADSPLKVVAKEMRERVPADVAAARIIREVSRPEPQDDLLSAIHHGIGQAILKADSGPGSISLPQDMSEHIAAAVRERCRIEPEPRITREEAHNLLTNYAICVADNRFSSSIGNDRKVQHSYEACLTVMLQLKSADSPPSLTQDPQP